MSGYRRRVRMNVLRGEPTDGSGKVCIHLSVPDPNGVFVEPHVLHPLVRDGQVVKQEVDARPTRSRLACDPRRSAAPTTVGGVTTVVHRTGEPAAVTCPRCIASEAYKKLVGEA